jgi:hypothetical protein
MAIDTIGPVLLGGGRSRCAYPTRFVCHRWCNLRRDIVGGKKIVGDILDKESCVALIECV